jgi:hypothetical protein
MCLPVHSSLLLLFLSCYWITVVNHRIDFKLKNHGKLKYFFIIRKIMESCETVPRKVRSNENSRESKKGFNDGHSLFLLPEMFFFEI